MSEMMIKVEGVSKEYRLGLIGGTTLREEIQRKIANLQGKEDPTLKIGEKRTNQKGNFMALSDVSFSVKAGEAVGIIGHNGAGKSTLLKLITRITAPSEGRIYLNGRVTSMLEVGTGFHPELTGRENIYINGAILGMSKKEIDAKIEEIIEFSEVRQFIDTPVKRYSSGMYVKLAFSVAAHLDSEIVIMDEVLAVGDVAFQNKCIEKMKSIAASGKTVLYVSHNMATIRSLCNRCIVLNAGKLEFDGEVEEAISHYLQSEHDVPYRCELQDAERHGNNLLNVKAVEAEFTAQRAQFEQGEDICICLQYRVDKPVDNIRIRYNLFTASQIPIGVVYPEHSVNIQSDGQVHLTMRTDCLNEGKYRLDLVIYTVDANKFETRQDCICNFMQFEIFKTFGTGELIKDWGHVVLPRMTVQELDR